MKFSNAPPTIGTLLMSPGMCSNVNCIPEPSGSNV